jgi:hypothetical protein
MHLSCSDTTGNPGCVVTLISLLVLCGPRVVNWASASSLESRFGQLSQWLRIEVIRKPAGACRDVHLDGVGRSLAWVKTRLAQNIPCGVPIASQATGIVYVHATCWKPVCTT